MRSCWSAGLPNRPGLLCCLLLVSVSGLLGQALPTASRSADVQVGIGFVYDISDYTPTDIAGNNVNLKGFALYGTYDLRPHWGGEFTFHQANSPTGDQVYQRTYEVGPRYHRTYGRFSPYVKAMYGRGVFNFPQGVANLAYNLIAGGIGTDVSVLPFLNLRAEYEYQDWFGFPPTNLKPQLITIGVAYHFPGGLKRGRHWGR